MNRIRRGEDAESVQSEQKVSHRGVAGKRHAGTVPDIDSGGSRQLIHQLLKRINGFLLQFLQMFRLILRVEDAIQDIFSVCDLLLIAAG